MNYVVDFRIRLRLEVERVIGFEPMLNGFADRRLIRLAIPAAQFRIWDFGLRI